MYMTFHKCLLENIKTNWSPLLTAKTPNIRQSSGGPYIKLCEDQRDRLEHAERLCFNMLTPILFNPNESPQNDISLEAALIIRL